MSEETQRTEVTTAEGTDKPTIGELLTSLQEQDKDVTVNVLPNGEAQVAQSPSADPAVDPQPDTDSGPADFTSEEIAQMAYAILAEELKFKGDFPLWDAVSERGRASYVESVEYVRRGMATEAQAVPRTRIEEIVLAMLSE